MQKYANENICQRHVRNHCSLQMVSMAGMHDCCTAFSNKQITTIDAITPYAKKLKKDNMQLQRSENT
jgi:hypothetical protein